MDDSLLFSAWGAGSAQAGAQLMGRHRNALRGYFFRRVRSASEDLVQHTFLRCLENRDSFRGECSFRTFLFIVARNLLNDHLRKEQRAAKQQTTVKASGAEPAESTTALVTRKESYELLEQSLHDLPPSLKAALQLHYWDELTVSEISVALNVPVGTVKSRLRRGRAALAEKLQHLQS